jgi:hypothetical protein
MQLQCLHMRQQSAPSPQQLVGESDPWRRTKSEKNQLWFSNTNRVLAEYRHGLWLYTSPSCVSGCCGHPLLKSSLEMQVLSPLSLLGNQGSKSKVFMQCSCCQVGRSSPLKITLTLIFHPPSQGHVLFTKVCYHHW